MTTRRLFTLLAACCSLAAWGQAPALPPLHVEGKWLADDGGRHVVLHGVMDTPNAYFNSGRWGWSYDDAGRQRCLDYFERLFAGLAEANCDVFRLHLDPAWTNDPSGSYTYDGAAGQAADAADEADISKFNPERLRTYLQTLYIPLMEKALAHGLYVVVRPPGVCPRNLRVGDYYQQYLLTVWDIVTQQAAVRQYAGQVSIELANEPVNLTAANGQQSTAALHDYFQPMVDKIRQNGFTGIVWAPGTGWQSNYQSYASHPITGANIGYAVHDYTGWYGCSDESVDRDGDLSASQTKKINQFRSQVPVVDSAPVIITEVDWSPEKPGAGHYNEHGDWVPANYGTWSTGSTSKWGSCYKAMLDHFGNISMTLSGSGCLIDVAQLLKDGSVVPAFDGELEACGKACMDWYAEWKHPAVIEGFSAEITSMDYITAGNRFMIGDGSRALFFKTNQDAERCAVGSLPLDGYYFYTLTPIAGYDDVYAVNIVNSSGTDYPSMYNLGHNLNVTSWGALFSGSAQAGVAQGYGTDGPGWGIWQVTYTEGRGFAFRNVGRGLYLTVDGTQASDSYVRLYRGLQVEGKVPADDTLFDLARATGYDASTGVLTGGWLFDEPVDISPWKYLMMTTSATAADQSHRIVISDADGRTASGEDYDAGTGGKMWLDRWNNQNAIRISIAYLRDRLGLDVTRIKSLTVNGFNPTDGYVPVSLAAVWLTQYNNTRISGGYAVGDHVRQYADAAHFGTVCLPYRAAPCGAVVYSVAGATEGSVSLTPLTGLMEAGTPYIYMATDAVGQNAAGAVSDVHFFRADSQDYDVAAPVSANGLCGTFSDITVPQGRDIYVLSNGRLWYTAGADVALGAHRAYLDRSRVGGSAASRVTISLAGEPTAAGRPDADPAPAGAALYDLQGRRVAAPRRGLYIAAPADGKPATRKVFIK